MKPALRQTTWSWSQVFLCCLAYCCQWNLIHSVNVPGTDFERHCFEAKEYEDIKIINPCINQVNARLEFSSYGLPSGSCDDGYTVNSCHSDVSARLAHLCLNEFDCSSLRVQNALLGDPCRGNRKRWYLSVYCDPDWNGINGQCSTLGEIECASQPECAWIKTKQSPDGLCALPCSSRTSEMQCLAEHPQQESLCSWTPFSQCRRSCTTLPETECQASNDMPCHWDGPHGCIQVRPVQRIMMKPHDYTAMGCRCAPEWEIPSSVADGVSSDTSAIHHGCSLPMNFHPDVVGGGGCGSPWCVVEGHCGNLYREGEGANGSGSNFHWDFCDIAKNVAEEGMTSGVNSTAVPDAGLGLFVCEGDDLNFQQDVTNAQWESYASAIAENREKRFGEHDVDGGGMSSGTLHWGKLGLYLQYERTRLSAPMPSHLNEMPTRWSDSGSTFEVWFAPAVTSDADDKQVLFAVTKGDGDCPADVYAKVVVDSRMRLSAHLRSGLSSNCEYHTFDEIQLIPDQLNYLGVSVSDDELCVITSTSLDQICVSSNNFASLEELSNDYWMHLFDLPGMEAHFAGSVVAMNVWRGVMPKAKLLGFSTSSIPLPGCSEDGEWPSTARGTIAQLATKARRCDADGEWQHVVYVNDATHCDWEGTGTAAVRLVRNSFGGSLVSDGFRKGVRLFDDNPQTNLLSSPPKELEGAAYVRNSWSNKGSSVAEVSIHLVNPSWVYLIRESEKKPPFWVTLNYEISELKIGTAWRGGPKENVIWRSRRLMHGTVVLGSNNGPGVGTKPAGHYVPIFTPEHCESRALLLGLRCPSLCGSCEDDGKGGLKGCPTSGGFELYADLSGDEKHDVGISACNRPSEDNSGDFEDADDVDDVDDVIPTAGDIRDVLTKTLNTRRFLSKQEACVAAGGSGLVNPVSIEINHVIVKSGINIAYAAPVINSVTHDEGLCVERDDRIVGCPSTGDSNILITVRGENFGRQGAIVTVGSKSCAGLQHVQGSEHTAVVCWLPSGDGTLSLSLQQRGHDHVAVLDEAVSYLVPDIAPGCTASMPHRCPDMTCSVSATTCGTNVCSDGLLQCASGECLPDPRDCPVFNGCTIGLPFKCTNGTCVSSDALCSSAIPQCPSTSPITCDDGSCVVTPTDCPKGEVECPDTLPFPCFDGSCKRSPLECLNNVGVEAMCPPTSPHRCSDGSCRSSVGLCPTLRPCPLSLPYLCLSGHCVSSADNCPMRTQECDTDEINCPDGFCRSCLDDLPCLQKSNLAASLLKFCPPYDGCDSVAPFRCKSGECVADQQQCFCTEPGNDGSSPTLLRCSTGECVEDAISCPIAYSNLKPVAFTLNAASSEQIKAPILAADTVPLGSVEADAGAFARCAGDNGAVQLSVQPVAKSQVDGIETSASTRLSLTIAGCETTEWRSPVSVSLASHGSDVTTKCLAFFNEEFGSWECVDNDLTVDPNNGFFVGATPHFSTFSIVDVAPKAPLQLDVDTYTDCEIGCATDAFRCQEDCHPDEAAWTDVLSCGQSAQCLMSSESDWVVLVGEDRSNATHPGYCEVTLPDCLSIECSSATAACEQDTACQESVECLGRCHTEALGDCVDRCGSDTAVYSALTDCLRQSSCEAPNLQCTDVFQGCAASSPTCRSAYSTCVPECLFRGRRCFDSCSNSPDEDAATDDYDSPTNWCPHEGVHHLCADLSCSLDGSFCDDNICWDPELPAQCRDGSCVAERGDCVLTNGCTVKEPFLCPGGGCVADEAECSEGRCLEDLPIQCANGLCVSHVEECLKGVRNCPSSVPYLCMDGTCRERSVFCEERGISGLCSGIICSDGSCVSRIELCPIIPTCPLDRPYRCLTSECVQVAGQCSGFNATHDCEFQGLHLCPDGRCYSCQLPGGCQWVDRVKVLESSCPPYHGCDPETLPHLCPDGICVRHPEDCRRCEDSRFKCSDKTCQEKAEDCQIPPTFSQVLDVKVTNDVKSQVDATILSENGVTGSVMAEPNTFDGCSSTSHTVQLHMQPVALSKVTEVSQLYSPVIDVSIVGCEWKGDRNVTLALFSSLQSVDGSCLAWFNEATRSWECQDNELERDETGLVIGRTTHFSAFAVYVPHTSLSTDEVLGVSLSDVKHAYVTTFVVAAWITASALVFVWAKLRDNARVNGKLEEWDAPSSPHDMYLAAEGKLLIITANRLKAFHPYLRIFFRPKHDPFTRPRQAFAIWSSIALELFLAAFFIQEGHVNTFTEDLLAGFLTLLVSKPYSMLLRFYWSQTKSSEFDDDNVAPYGQFADRVCTCIAACVGGAASALSIVYGVSYTHATEMSWATAVAVSFITNVFVSSPLRNFLRASLTVIRYRRKYRPKYGMSRGERIQKAHNLRVKEYQLQESALDLKSLLIDNSRAVDPDETPFERDEKHKQRKVKKQRLRKSKRGRKKRDSTSKDGEKVREKPKQLRRKEDFGVDVFGEESSPDESEAIMNLDGNAPVQQDCESDLVSERGERSERSERSETSTYSDRYEARSSARVTRIKALKHEIKKNVRQAEAAPICPTERKVVHGKYDLNTGKIAKPKTGGRKLRLFRISQPATSTGGDANVREHSVQTAHEIAKEDNNANESVLPPVDDSVAAGKQPRRRRLMLRKGLHHDANVKEGIETNGNDSSEAAATTIQAAFRGRKARRRVLKLRKAEESAENDKGAFFALVEDIKSELFLNGQYLRQVDPEEMYLRAAETGVAPTNWKEFIRAELQM